MDVWLLVSDATVLFLVGAGVAAGFLIGRAGRHTEYVYIEDDPEGGVRSAPHFDPDAPVPGDALYPPSEWFTEVNA